MLKIESRSNERIKYAVSLRESAKNRAQSGEFLIEGARLCRDAAQSGLEIRCAFFTAEALERYGEYINVIKTAARECYELAEHISAKLSETAGSQGVFCICAVPAQKSDGDIEASGKYLALENIQDPSNFGAICRTAEALGLTGLIVCGGCDIYNPKALRAAMGSSFRVNIIMCGNLPQLIKTAAAKGMNTLASTPDSGAADIRAVDFNGGVIAVVGNEGAGVSDETLRECKQTVTIPMHGKAESLNAAAAAAIIAWEMMRA